MLNMIRTWKALLSIQSEYCVFCEYSHFPQQIKVPTKVFKLEKPRLQQNSYSVYIQVMTQAGL